MLVKKLIFGLLLFSTVATATGVSLILINKGLDTNSQDNIDLTLETSSKEEAMFDDVANLISAFVKTQRDIKDQISKALKKDRSSKRFSLAKKTRDQYQKILSDLPNKGKYATRDVHRKTHGCYKAEIKFDDNVKEKLNDEILSIIQDRKGEEIEGKNHIPEVIESDADLGVFHNGAKYNAIVRLSNGHPGNRADKLPDARGFAVKMLPAFLDINKVSAEDVNKNTLLDILNINFPTFFVNSASKYLVINRWFLKSSEDNQGILAKLYEGFSVFGPKWLKGAGMTKLEKILALKVNGSVIHHPLYEEYFSMVPSRLGHKGQARAVKYSWVPSSCEESGKQPEYYDYFKPEWSKDHNYAYPSKGLPLIEPNIPPFEMAHSKYWGHYYLRDRVENTLKKGEHCYELHVQLYRDQDSTNIEDSLDVWLRSEEERDYWMDDVVSEVKDPAYRDRISNKKIARNIKIATLKFDQLDYKDQVKNTKFCEDLSFNPWHGNIEFHKPLGQVSRMKQKVYNTVRRHRHELNGIDSKSMERGK